MKTFSATRWIACSIAILSLLVLLGAGWLQPWERALLQKIHQQATPPSPIVALAMSDIGSDPWPWHHLDYALILRAVSRYSPRVIGFEPPLTHAEILFPVYDKQLIHVMSHLSSPLVLSTAGTHADLAKPPPLTYDSIPYEGILNVPETFLDWGDATFHSLSSKGHLNVLRDSESAPLRMPLLHRVGNQLIPSWVLSIFGNYHQVSWQNSRVILGKHIQLKQADGSAVASIPIDEDLALTLNVTPEPPFRVYEFWNTLLASEQALNNQSPAVDLRALRQQCVLIYRAHPQMVNFIATPVGLKPAGELAGTALHQLFQMKQPSSLSTLWSVVLVIALFLVALVFPKIKWLVLMSIAVLLLSLWFYSSLALHIPFSTLMLGLGLGYLCRR